MAKFERSAILKKFRAMAARGEPIVGGGAGTGFPPNARKPAAST